MRRRSGDIICVCGKPIQGCGCGGTACPGWRHLGEWGGHYCGNQPEPKAHPREEAGDA